MPTTEPLLEIRLLGPMVVLRRDRSMIDDADWNSGKTRDLLRLLALQSGRPVPTQMLIDRLWPHVAGKQARGSLRTAASQVRRTVREDCIVRGPGTMTLVDAWVDTVLVGGLLGAGREAVVAGRADLVVSRARAVERLYHGDFHAYDDDSGWAVAERERLARGRLDLLMNAAEACLGAGDHHEALLYANAVLFADPGIEAAYRAKMRAHAELGESGNAMRTFERLRRQLAEDQGIDPSPETRELHRQILRGV